MKKIRILMVFLALAAAGIAFPASAQVYYYNYNPYGGYYNYNPYYNNPYYNPYGASLYTGSGYYSNYAYAYNNSPYNAYPPNIAQTLPATNITSESATLNGRISWGAPVLYRFEYGNSTALGNGTSWTLSNSGSPDVSYAITNFIPGFAYYYRLNVQMPDGTRVPGQIVNFTAASGANVSSSAGNSTTAASFAYASPVQSQNLYGTNSASGNYGSYIVPAAETDNGYAPSAQPSAWQAFLKGIGYRSVSNKPCFTMTTATDNATIVRGDSFTATVFLKNACAVSFTNMTLRISVPPGLTVKTTSVPATSMDAATNDLVFVLKNIPANAQETLQVAYAAGGEAAAGTSYTVTSTLKFKDGGKSHAIRSSLIVTLKNSLTASILSAFGLGGGSSPAQSQKDLYKSGKPAAPAATPVDIRTLLFNGVLIVVGLGLVAWVYFDRKATLGGVKTAR